MRKLIRKRKKDYVKAGVLLIIITFLSANSAALMTIDDKGGKFEEPSYLSIYGYNIDNDFHDVKFYVLEDGYIGTAYDVPPFGGYYESVETPVMTGMNHEVWITWYDDGSWHETEGSVYVSPGQHIQVRLDTTLFGFSDGDLDNLEDSLEDTLLETFAPVVFLHPNEQNWPCNVDWYLTQSHMRFHHDGGCSDCGIIDHGYPNQQNIIEQEHQHKNWLCSHSGSWEQSWYDFNENECFFLQQYNPTHEGIHPWDFGGHGSEQWIVYGHVFPNNFGGINVQYWFCYAYSEGWQGVGNHEGEWENIIVELYNDFSVRDVVYFRHYENPHTISVGDVEWYGSHPIVISGLGTHASYEDFDTCADQFFEDGCFWCTPVDLCENAWFTWENGKPAYSPGYQGGGVVNVGEHVYGERTRHLNGQSFIHYSGRWGEIGPVNSGPQGPAYQTDKWCHNMGSPPTSSYEYQYLEKFPFYYAEEISGHTLDETCGAATAQMILSYLFWNSNQYPDGPAPYSNQHSLQHLFHPAGTGYITPDEMVAGLNRVIDDRNHSWQYGYFFNKVQHSNVDTVLREICLWLYYPVDFYNDQRPVDVPMPGHPNNVPVAAPIFGYYGGWLAIRGIYSDGDPWESYPNFPPSITIYGLWVNDPWPGELLAPTYVTIDSWKNYWYEPINGQYVAVVDPPSGITDTVLSDLENIELTYEAETTAYPSLFEAEQKDMLPFTTEKTPGLPKETNEKIITRAARTAMNTLLVRCNSEYAGVFSQCVAEQIISVDNEKTMQDYNLVVFKGNEQSFVVRLSADQGLLLDFSVCSLKSITQYLREFQGATQMQYREGSPYYPETLS